MHAADVDLCIARDKAEAWTHGWPGLYQHSRAVATTVFQYASHVFSLFLIAGGSPSMVVVFFCFIKLL